MALFSGAEGGDEFFGVIPGEIPFRALRGAARLR
jgi:hypothetical protein